jgi:phosphonate transport system substrate-binding protein
MAVALVVFVCVQSAGSAAPAAEPEKPENGSGRNYRFGVFPYLPVLTIDRIFGPMAAAFAEALGRPVYLKTKSTFEQFVIELRHESYDVVFVHPFLYVDAADRHGYLPLARLAGGLTAVVVVQSDRPWRTWADLAGKVLAAPPPLAAVSEMASVALLDAGLLPGIDTTFVHYRTKASCLHAVSIGDADGCVLPGFVLGQIGEIAQGRLRIMVESGAIQHLVFAAHPRVPEAERAKLRALITSWPQTEAGRAILAAGSWTRFVAAQDADYDEVRRHAIRLERLAQR